MLPAPQRSPGVSFSAIVRVVLNEILQLVDQPSGFALVPGRDRLEVFEEEHDVAPLAAQEIRSQVLEGLGIARLEAASSNVFRRPSIRSFRLAIGGLGRRRFRHPDQVGERLPGR